jgi:CelD/BcsL family acetyltransferase involved in cellulose biosynthesis
MQSFSSLDVQYYHGLSGLDSMRCEWQRLYDRCGDQTFYNDWRWHQAIQKHLIHSDICYVLVSRGNEPVAILPLVACRKWKGFLPVRQLSFPYRRAIDLTDMLVADSYERTKVLEVILVALRNRPPCPWDQLELGRFIEDSCLARQLRLHGWFTYPDDYSSAFVRADEEAESLLDHLSKKQIKNVRRHLRNAEDAYGECSIVQALGRDAIGPLYETFLQLEASGWKGIDGTGSAISLRTDERAFYQEVLALFGETNQAQINVVYFGAEPVAAQIGLRTPARLSLLKIGYDEKYRDVGPGAIALLKTIEGAQGRPFEISLVTCPSWSERWHFPRTTRLWFESYNTTVYGWFVKLSAVGIRCFRQAFRSR